MRITCVIANLGGGGAERVMTYLCQGLATRGHQVTLLTLDNSTSDFYTLPASVTRARVHLPTFRTAGPLGSIARLIKLTRAVHRTHPQVVISFMTVTVVVSCLLLRVPIVYADHLDVRHTIFSRKWEILRNYLLRFTRAVTVLSERDFQFAKTNYPKWPVRVVYNPALPQQTDRPVRPPFMKPDTNYVLAVGRLVEQKGFERLLRIWQQAQQNGWRLAIVGSGPQEQSLKTLAQELGVTATVDFVPPQQEIFSAYIHAQIFAMSSRTEGFPMVLLEAMSAGLPAVSFDCTGPDVIIRSGVDGILVPQDDKTAFVRALSDLMSDADKRRSLGERAKEVANRFSLEKYIDAYEELCQNPIS